MKRFFDNIRVSFGPLRQEQVDGFTLLCKASNDLPLRHKAYLLATAWHETAATMQPIHERGKLSYFDKYEPGTKIGKALGNTVRGDGYKYRGRGYVQITGRRNYGLASKHLGVDLLAAPDHALEPANAARIIVLGMVQGWFTGKKLADYQSYEDMRRVVNGVDRAVPIAERAWVFEKALTAQAQADAAVILPLPPDVEPTPPPKIRGKPSIQSVMMWVIGAIAAAIAAWFGFGR
jgi:hypothetical protein